jgi:hypothetical protein
MTDNSDNVRDTRNLYREALVPLLAFGSTILGIVLWNAGVHFEIQYAGAGGFLASCLLAYLAWLRPRKDIVSLTTPIYGFIFFVTPIDYTGGVVIHLLYAGGLTVLVIRLHYRFGKSASDVGKNLAAGPHRDYVESTRDTFTTLDPVQRRLSSVSRRENTRRRQTCRMPPSAMTGRPSLLSGHLASSASTRSCLTRTCPARRPT